MLRFYHVVNLHFRSLWIKYSLFIKQKTQPKQKSDCSTIIWQNKFFTRIIRYGLPAAVIAIIPSTIIQYHHSKILSLTADLLILASIIIIVLSERIAMHYKKISGLGFIVIFAIIKIITLNSLLFGSIFLLLFSLFATLLFGKKIAYFSVLLNVAICSYFTTFQMDKAQKQSLDLIQSQLGQRWLFYSLNFIFINFILVAIIQYIVDSFERNINTSKRLYQKVSLEVQRRIDKGKQLQESLSHYKALFIFNPVPMMIYDPLSLKLHYVNQAAIRAYGYTRKEFLDISVNRLAKTDHTTFREKIQHNHHHIRDKHYHKDGSLLFVDIHASNVRLRGAWLRLAIIRDITAEKTYINTIERRNEKMREIAYIQSHIIRNPLSKILGITQLMQSDKIASNELLPYIIHLTDSAKELDDVVTNIIRKTENELRDI